MSRCRIYEGGEGKEEAACRSDVIRDEVKKMMFGWDGGMG